jgi:hypothetical protein
METCDQVHVLATFSLEREPHHLLNTELGVAQSWSVCFREEENLSPAGNQTMNSQLSIPQPSHYNNYGIAASHTENWKVN